MPNDFPMHLFVHSAPLFNYLFFKFHRMLSENQLATINSLFTFIFTTMKTRPLLLSICCAFTFFGNAQTINNTGSGYIGTPPGTNSQVQNAMDNQLMIQGASAFSTPALQNNIKVGIGYFPLNNIFDRVHVHDNSASATAMRFSNTVTGINLTSGFRVGINAAGHAALLQLENLPMRFATNAIERMLPTHHFWFFPSQHWPLSMVTRWLSYGGSLIFHWVSYQSTQSRN